MGKPTDYFDVESLHSDLKGKTVRGGAYTAAAQIVRILISLASIPILARLLTPADFGLVAMVTVVTGFAAMFVDAGLSMATVQREDITHRQVSNLFWLAVTLGSGLAVLVSALSPLIAWFYNEPRLIGITLALVGSFVLSGLTIQHQALLRRVMQLKALAIIQIASLVVGQSLAVLWAWRFHNYWALVIMPLATALTQLVGTWIACSWRPSLPARGSGVRPMVAFGANLTGFNFVNYFARNTDKLLIGWYWGQELLGFYERAYKLMMFPLQSFNGPLSSVALPMLSRLASKEDSYLKAYQFILGKISCVAGAVVVFLMVNSDWVIEIVLGKPWLPSAPIFAWLALAGLRQLSTNPTGWLLVSQGRSREMFAFSIIGVPITLGSFAIGLPYGPEAVAACYAIIPLLIGTPILFWVVGRTGPVGTAELWIAFLRPLQIPLSLWVALSVFRLFVGPVSPWIGLPLALLIAVLVWCVAMTSTRVGRTNLQEFGEISRSLRQTQMTPD